MDIIDMRNFIGAIGRMDQRFKNISMNGVDALAFLLLALPFLILFTSTLSLMLNYKITALCFWLPLLFVLVVGYFVRTSRQIWLQPTVMFVLILCISLIVSWYIQDFTWDSRQYHIPGSILISNGWNPIYNNIPTTGKFIDLFAIRFYPKGQAIIMAAILHAFGSFEIAKFDKYLYLISSFLIVYRTLLKAYGFRKFSAVFMAFTCTFNTVVIFQLTINYIDGAIASLYVIELFSLLGFMRTKDFFYIWVLALSAILMISLKTSGLFYSLSILGAISIWHLLKNGIKAWKVPVAMGLIILLGIVISFNPYITNTLEKGNPLYPFGTQVAKKHIKRPYFKDMNRFERYFFAYTSAPNVFLGNEQEALPVWRSPFRIDNWSGYWLPEDLARTIGAFGPFFPFIMIPTLVLILFLEQDLMIAVAVILFTLFAHREGWHARYCPQTLLIPCLIFISLISNNWRNRGRPVAYVALSIMLLSEFILYSNGPSVLGQSRSYRELAKQYRNTFGVVDQSFIRQFIPEYVLTSDKGDAPSFIMTETERLKDLGYQVTDTHINKAAYQSLNKFLSAYDQNTIVISVKDDATKCLPKNFVTMIDGEGGHLSKLPYQGSYVAVIHHARVVYDALSADNPITFTALNDTQLHLPYQIVASSAGSNAGNYSSVKINGNDFSSNRRGLNVVALIGGVAISRNFDTYSCAKEFSMPTMFAIPLRR